MDSDTAYFDKIFTPSENFLMRVRGASLRPILTKIHQYESKQNMMLGKEDEIFTYPIQCVDDLAKSTFKSIEEHLSIENYSGTYVRFGRNNIVNLFSELIGNAYEFSPEDTGLVIKSYYGRNLALGFYDTGTFFKQDWVKRSIENREMILSKDYRPESLSNDCNMGLRNLYATGSFLEVDNVNGVLYVGLSREKLLEKQDSRIQTSYD